MGESTGPPSFFDIIASVGRPLAIRSLPWRVLVLLTIFSSGFENGLNPGESFFLNHHLLSVLHFFLGHSREPQSLSNPKPLTFTEPAVPLSSHIRFSHFILIFIGMKPTPN